MVINKFGDELPADLIAVPKGQNHYKGVQEELLGPGRYFIDPVEYDTKPVKLTEIPAGDPQTWRFDKDGHLTDQGSQPMVGLIACKQGKTPPPGVEVVDPGFKGIQKEVLTPGTYKINPHLYEVTLVPAVVVPPGYVGVVTRLTGDRGPATSATLTEIRAQTSGPTTQFSDNPTTSAVPSRLVTGANQRGILKNVLQPGIYYLNPRLTKVDVVPVGYDAIDLEHVTSTGKQTNNYNANAGTPSAFTATTAIWSKPISRSSGASRPPMRPTSSPTSATGTAFAATSSSPR